MKIQNLIAFACNMCYNKNNNSNGGNSMKKFICLLLSLILIFPVLSGCNDIYHKDSILSSDTITDNETVELSETQLNTSIAETVEIEGEYDPATNMRYSLIDGGTAYSVCPEGLPEVIKELVIPGEYKGLPVTEIRGKFFEHSIETVIISDGIKEISMSFSYRCSDLKNIYIPSSVIHIDQGAFNTRHTMGDPGFIKSNVIEKIVVAEGNPYYYVDGNCLIDKRSQKIILGCNSSIIPNDGSVKSIGYAAFANCKSIEKIILPKSVIELEYAAFDNCPNLKQVNITSSISKDKKIVKFDAETVFGYASERIFYVPDAESLEVYSKLFEPYTNFEIGTSPIGFAIKTYGLFHA